MLVPWTGEYVARVQNTTAPLSEGRGEYTSDSGAEWLQYCAGVVLIVKGSDHTGWPVRQTSTKFLSWGQGVQTEHESGQIEGVDS